MLIEPVDYRIDCIVGARPNFVKIAPIIREIRRHRRLNARLIHTGQHHDPGMNAVFFQELDIPAPDLDLGVGAGSQTEQTARMMLALEPAFTQARPDLLVVVGDVTSTLAATLVAVKMGIPVAHVEAGLRSSDRSMPEEVNRLVVDRLSSLLFASERSGVDHLAGEGVPSGQVMLVGNVMIDTLFTCLGRAVAPAATLHEVGASRGFLAAVAARGFGLVTLHRPSNVDDPATLVPLLDALAQVSRSVPLVFPVHPRTRAVMARHGLDAAFAGHDVLTTPPLSYLRAIGLMRDARLVVTDSGGVQEETTALGTPCLTVRDSTERPITIAEGTNILVGTDPAALPRVVEDILRDGKVGRRPALWDGHAAERIVAACLAYLDARPRPPPRGAPSPTASTSGPVRARDPRDDAAVPGEGAPNGADGSAPAAGP